jgi:hypothetical protein
MNIYRVYLRAALALGFVDHVYNMTDRLGALVGKKKMDAAWEMSQQLVEHHGYHACPSCGWAQKKRGEHIARGSDNWCYDEAFNRRYGVYPHDEVDGVPAHNLYPHLTGEEDTDSEREIEMYGYDHRIPWDKQPDGVSAFLATPDSVMDRMFR